MQLGCLCLDLLTYVPSSSYHCFLVYFVHHRSIFEIKLGSQIRKQNNTPFIPSYLSLQLCSKSNISNLDQAYKKICKFPHYQYIFHGGFNETSLMLYFKKTTSSGRIYKTMDYTVTQLPALYYPQSRKHAKHGVFSVFSSLEA